jgi:23S rRNA (cytosine1962-C5)-methyltransferase
MPSVFLKKNKERRLYAGHSWVYSSEIERITGDPDPRDGDAVDIRDHKDRFFGRGFLNTKSQITVRRFTMAKEELDRAFFTRRIEQALAYRREDTSIGDTEAFRVVSSEGDQLPGLVVDQYGDNLVIQALTKGIDQRKGQIVEILREIFQPRAIIERNDVPSRKLEGLEETKGVLFGETGAIVRAQFAGFSIEVNLLEDQKTGFFLDQRDNYQEVARLCTGKRVLDCFTYHGGFALAAAMASAKSVECVEISDIAIARARKNAELNGLTGKIQFVCANAFDVLKKYDVDKRQYDVIILDPPTFTRTRQNVEGALRGYKEINLRALKMLPPGGILATFTCSHHIDAELFKSIVVEAAADAKRTVRLVKVLSQSPDHPILPAIPETEYLRGLLLEVM